MALDIVGRIAGTSANERLAAEGLEHAIRILEGQLEGSVPVNLKAEFLALGPGVGGGGKPSTLFANRSGFPEMDTWYPPALASQLHGTSLTPNPPHELAGYHMYACLNSDLPWHYKINEPCPSGKCDFLTTALHELGHGLGFAKTMNADGQWAGEEGRKYPGICESQLTWWDGMFFWWDLEDLVPAERYGAIRSQDLFWEGPNIAFQGQLMVPQAGISDPEGYAEVYAPMVWTGSSVSHWDEAHDPDQLMEPEASGLFGSKVIHHIGLLRQALMDMGWEFRRTAAVPTRLPFHEVAAAKGVSLPQYVLVANNTTNSTCQITSVALSGPHTDQFLITSGGDPTALGPMATHTVGVAFDPTSVGRKLAVLEIAYNDGTAKVFEIALVGSAVGDDADGDGLSDTDETRDLNPCLSGVQNPFNAADADSTGDGWQAASDGFEDGFNDWDSDGMSNADEFLFGYNPIDPNSVGHPSASDSDGDGLLDVYETLDLDELTPGIQTPFDPYIGDSTGDAGLDAGDGVPDGQNDYDGDGMSNAREFFYGLNPANSRENARLMPSAGWAGQLALLIALLAISARYASRHKAITTRGAHD